MITPAGKQRFMRQHDSEPAILYAAVLKCTAALLVIALIAVIGVQGDSGSPLEPSVAKRVPAEIQTSASIADVRKLMEERRARLDQRANASGAEPAARRSALDRDAVDAPTIQEVTLLRRERAPGS